jgi:mono/diheme cytochrome c family protein
MMRTAAPRHFEMRRAAVLAAAIFGLSACLAPHVTSADTPAQALPPIATPPTPAPPPPPPPLAFPAQPEEPIPAKAYAVLDRQCAKCHQAGKTELSRPADGFGNVLDLATLQRNLTLVRPGNPDASRLYTLMQSRVAPHNFAADDLSNADLDAVREWIQLAKPAGSCTDQPPVTSDAVTTAIEKVLAELSPDGAKTQRFLSLTHLHNACATKPEMTAYLQAATNMINGLSWGLEPVALEAVDEANTVFKIDLARIGWDAQKWDRLAGAYPYTAAYAPTQPIQQRTGTSSPLLRADWFVTVAGRAPLYYELLTLPDRVSALFAGLKVDPNAAVVPGRVKRIGLKASRVARGNRLLQRQSFANGGIWTTYEYAPTPGRPDLFDTPGGPGTRGAPRPDASLIMFSLPSGFNAFFMANGEGVRINDVPQSVLFDDANPTSRITAGTPCLACHDKGAVTATDELRQRVQTDASVPRDIRERVLAMHDSADEMKKLFDDDIARLEKAQTAAAMKPGLTLDGVDPVSALAARYDRNVSLQDLASELHIAAANLSSLTGHSLPVVADLIQRLVHGPVPRREIELAFPQMAAAVLPAAAAENKAAATSSATPAMPLTASVVTATSPFDLILKTGPSEFKTGDTLTITVRATESCYLTLINVDKTGRGTVVFPNDFDQNNFMDANKELRVPADGAPYNFRLREPGRETVIGICQTAQKTPFGIKHDFERQRFTELGDYRSFLIRSAATASEDASLAKNNDRQRNARPRRGRSAEPAPVLGNGKPDNQARTAVQFDIK